MISLTPEEDHLIRELIQNAVGGARKPKDLAQSITRLSDFYIASPTHATPWQETWARAAYASYFLPLNLIRVKAVLAEVDRLNFFRGLDRFIEIGSGPGTLTRPLSDRIKRGFSVERGEVARLWQMRFLAGRNIDLIDDKQWLAQSSRAGGPTTLAAFSYALTELDRVPAWVYQCEAVLIIEPSTRDDGRRLLKIREDLLKKGYHAWAPCLHQGECPLLKNSARDWCHMRLHWEMPDWYRDIEEHLSFKNKTLTYSYLLMRRTKKGDLPAAEARFRVVGDALVERGKTRVLVCRNEQREFLSWLHKDSDFDLPKRGDILEIKGVLEKKADEVRVGPKNSISITRN